VVLRSTRWLREQSAFLAVLLCLAAAFAYLLVEPRHPVRGTLAIAVVALLAGVLRLFLPAARAGWLVIRSRWLDTACYVVLGGLILVAVIRLRH
jgi:hypothetical protein